MRCLRCWTFSTAPPRPCTLARLPRIQRAGSQILRRGVVALAVLAAAIVPPAVLADRSQTASSAARVTVRLSAARQVIRGFGGSERSWTDPHLAGSANVNVPAPVQAQILTALYKKLGLTMVRDLIDPGIQGYAGGPLNFAKADAQARYVKQARLYGLKTFFPAPVYLEGWMTPSDPASYVDWAMALLERWRSLGVTPPYYSVLNEPQVAKNFPPQWLHDVVIQLGQRMRAAGFKTKLIIPDDENPIDGYRRAVAVLQDPQARKYVGAVAFHIYRIGGPSDWAKLRRLASQYKLPLWMTEYTNPSYSTYPGAFDWAVKIHELLTTGGVNAVFYLWGFFGDWKAGSAAAPITIHFNKGVFVSWSKTPLYYLMGQYSKFVRPGFTRVDASSSDSAVLVSAYKHAKRVVVVAVNTASDTQTLRVHVSGGAILRKVSLVQTTAGGGLKALKPLRSRHGAFGTVLPAESVTTFLVGRPR